MAGASKGLTEQAPKPIATLDLPTSNLVPNAFNSNVMTDEDYTRLHEEAKTKKKVPGFVAAKCLEKGQDHAAHKHEIIDGFFRWSAAKDLKIPKISVQIFNVDDYGSRVVCYLTNSVRGAQDPLKEGILLSQACDLRPVSEVCEDFLVSRSYLLRRTKLVKIRSHYEKFGGVSDKVSIGHLEVIADFWRSSDDDQTVEEAIRHLTEEGYALNVTELQRLLSQIRTNKERMVQEVEQAIQEDNKSKAIPDVQVVRSSGKGKKQTAPPPPPPQQTRREVPANDEVEVIKVDPGYVRDTSWHDPSPPTSATDLFCDVCKTEKQLVIWEKPIEIPVEIEGVGPKGKLAVYVNGEKTPGAVATMKDNQFTVKMVIKGVDKKGELLSSVTDVQFRPKKKPFERIYTEERYQELGIVQVVRKQGKT
jgi:hypothetical protein